MSETSNIREIVREEIELFYKEEEEKKKVVKKVELDVAYKKGFKINFIAFNVASILASLLFSLFPLTGYGAKYYLYFGPAYLFSLIAFLLIHKAKVSSEKKIDLSLIPFLISLVGLATPIIIFS